MRSSGRALLALVAVTIIWGWSFVWMKQALETAASFGAGGHLAAAIGLFMTLRFTLSTALLLAAVPSARRDYTPGAIRGGLLIGVCFLAGFGLQMFGLDGVTPAVSAFLTSLYVVFSALLAAVLDRRAPRAGLLVGVVLSTFGAGFIQGPPQLTFGVHEWLTVGCAFAFAGQILATDRVTRAHPPMPVTAVSLGLVALGSAALLAFTGFGGGPGLSKLAGLAVAPGFLVPMVLSSVLSSLIAIVLMNLYQRELDPVRAAIVYALEPVWTTVIALGYGMDGTGPWLWIGGGALLAGNLVAEFGVRSHDASSESR